MSSEAKLLSWLVPILLLFHERAALLEGWGLSRAGSRGPAVSPGQWVGRWLPKRAFTGERGTWHGFAAPSSGRSDPAPGCCFRHGSGCSAGAVPAGAVRPFRAEPVRLPRLPPGAGEDRQQPAANPAGNCPLSVRDRAVPGGGASGPVERAGRGGCVPLRSAPHPLPFSSVFLERRRVPPPLGCRCPLWCGQRAGTVG